MIFTKQEKLEIVENLFISIYKNEHKEHIAFKYKDTPRSRTEVHKITYSKFASDIENIGTKLLDMGN